MWLFLSPLKQTCEEENIANGQAMVYSPLLFTAVTFKCLFAHKTNRFEEGKFEVSLQPQKTNKFLYVCTHTHGHIYIFDRKREQNE